MWDLRFAIGELMSKGKEIDKELAATVILEAAFTTDEKACTKYGVSVRSLQRYRKALATDPILAGVFATKKAAFDKAWAGTIPIALRKGIELIGRMYDAIRDDPMMIKNPNALSAVADAIKACADVAFTGQFIDARLVSKNQPQDGLPGPDAATATGDSVH